MSNINAASASLKRSSSFLLPAIPPNEINPQQALFHKPTSQPVDVTTSSQRRRYSVESQPSQVGNDLRASLLERSDSCSNLGYVKSRNTITTPPEPPKTTPKLNKFAKYSGGVASVFGAIGLGLYFTSYAIPGVNIVTLGVTLGVGLVFLIGSLIKGRIDKNRINKHAKILSGVMNTPNTGIELSKTKTSENTSIQRTRKIYLLGPQVDQIALKTSASTAKKQNDAIVNQYTTINNFNESKDLPVTTQFRCGAIHTIEAAKQYVVGMLLANINQLGDTLHLIDTRYLNDSYFYHKEPQMFKKHIELINKALESIKTNGLRSVIQELRNKDLITDNLSDATIDILATKNVEFHSVNLGPEKGWKGSGLTDQANIAELKSIVGVFIEKNPQSPQAILWINELKSITDNVGFERSGKNNPFISGENAFHTQYLIAKLSALCGIVPSSGCKSNKDRGTSEHIFESCLDAVFADRENNQEEKNDPNYSVKDFKLNNQAERDLVISVLDLKLSDAVTKANTGKAGNKNLSGLKHLIKMAFTNDLGELDGAGYEAMEKSIKGDSAGVSR